MTRAIQREYLLLVRGDTQAMPEWRTAVPQGDPAGAAAERG
jgi:hypothetical protein